MADPTVNITGGPKVYLRNGDQVAVVTLGIKGDPGSPGTDDHYAHTQSTPSATWVVVHGLGKHPAVTVVDSAGSVVEGDIVYDSLNQVTLIFSAGFSGKAYFN